MVKKRIPQRRYARKRPIGRPTKKPVKKTSTKIHKKRKTTKPRKKGWLLTTYLVLVLLGFMGSVYTYFFNTANLGVLNFPRWILWSYRILSILGIIFVIAALKWKRWGIYGFVAVAIFSAILNTQIVGLLASVAVFLIGIIILILIIKNKWKYFE